MVLIAAGSLASTDVRAHAEAMRPSRRRLLAVGAIAAALALPNVTSAIGVVLAPQLLAHAPLVLLMLHPYEPFAVLVLPQVPVAVFVLVAVLFRLGPRYLCFIAGRSGGQDEIERYLRSRPRGRVARAMPTSRRLISPALVVLASAPVSAMAGALGVRTRRFLLLSILGAALPTLLLVVVGTVAAGPVRRAADATRSQPELWWGLSLAVLLVLGLWALLRRRALRDRADEEPRLTEDERPFDQPAEPAMLPTRRAPGSRDRQ